MAKRRIELEYTYAELSAWVEDDLPGDWRPADLVEVQPYGGSTPEDPKQAGVRFTFTAHDEGEEGEA